MTPPIAIDGSAPYNSKSAQKNPGHPLRIALISYCYFPHEFGGGERSTRLLAQALASRGCDVRVFSVAPTLAEEGWMEVDGIPVFRVPLDHPYYYPVARPTPLEKVRWHLANQFFGSRYREMIETLREFSPDVVHLSQFTGFSPNLIRELCANIPAPIVYSGRDYVLLDMRTLCFERGHIAINTLRQRLQTLRKRHWSRKIHSFLFNSSRTREIHETALPWIVGKSKVIHTDPPPGPVRMRAWTSQPRHRALIIGKLSEEKGVLQALRAIHASPDLPLEVMVAGTGPLLSDVQAICATDERFTYAGVVDGERKERLFLDADLLIQPSLWEEPYPRVIYEAFFHGLGVIATNIGGNAEMLGDGERGVLFSWNDPESFMRSLDFTDKDAWHQRLERAREFVEKMQRESSADACLEVYRELVELGKARTP